MFLNQSNLHDILNDLDRSINEHIISKDLFFTDCNCGTPNQIGKCFNCRVDDVIEDLKCLHSHLKPFASQTNYLVQYIDAEAFRFALLKSGQFDNVTCTPVFDNPIAEENYETPKDANGFVIEATIERFAMDGVGFHVGYEKVTFQWNCIDKSQLGITGIPYILSKWVVNPEQYDIVNRDYPEQEEIEHDSDCEMNREPDGECDCGAIEGLYYPPEDDFWYQQLDFILDTIDYPDTQFNSDTRIWELGDLKYDMNRFQDDPFYQNQLNDNNGAPLIG